MTKNSVPIWIQIHFNSFRAFFRFLKKCYPYLLIVILIFYIIFLLHAFWAFYRGTSTICCSFLSECDIKICLNLLVKYQIIKFIVAAADITTILSLGILFYFIWMLSSFAIDIIYRFFSNDSLRFQKQYRRYLSCFKKTIYKRVSVFAFIITVISIFYMIKIEMYNLKIENVTKQLSYIFTVAILLIYSSIWSSYLIIRRSRYLKSRNTLRFDYYLFSRESINRRLKNIFDALVFFSLLGWFFWPLLLYSCKAIELQATNFLTSSTFTSANWSIINKYGYNNQSLEYNASILPSLSDLQKSLSFLGELYNIPKRLPYFQHKMFSIFTVIASLEIGLPSIINIILFKTKRSVFINLVFSVVRTTILILGLKIFIAKAFYINTSAILSDSTIFFFIISVFLKQQSVNILNITENVQQCAAPDRYSAGAPSGR